MKKLLLLLLLAGNAFAATLVQDGGTGLLVMEGESFASNNAGGGVGAWIQTADASASNSLTMKANTGLFTGAADTSNMVYDVEFVNAGNYYSWIRYKSFNTGSDSVFVQLAGNTPVQINTTVLTGTLSWARVATNAATIPVGLTTVTVWRRESNIEIDKLVITSDAAYTPTGAGPAEGSAGNTPPVITAIPDQSVSSGNTLVVNVTTSDADGDTVSLAVSGLPAYGSFVDNGNGTGDITISPSPSDTGNFSVLVTATDNGTPPAQDTEPFGLTVGELLAFPTAVGFGRFTEGGRGGSICHVDRLTASGAGSVDDVSNGIYSGDIVYCMRSVNGPRVIVFDVSGQIAIPNHLGRNDGTDANYTMACQTAPSPGVYFSGGGFLVDQDNVIIRHCRFRSTSTDGFSTFQVGDTSGTQPNDVIADHSSFVYHWDETHNVVMPNGHEPCVANNNGNCIDRVTMQYSIMAEGLGPISGGSGNGIGSDSKCTLYNGVRGLTMFKNIIANCSYRMPQQYDGEVEYINNIWYNWGNSSAAAGIFEAFWDVAHYSFIGNNRIKGPQSDNDSLKWGTNGPTQFESQMTVYLEGNRHPVHRPNDTLPEGDYLTTGIPSGFAGRVISQPRTTPTPGFMQSGWVTAEQALIDVLGSNGAGASVPAFDAVDAGNRANVASGGSSGDIPQSLADTIAGLPSFAQNSQSFTDTDYDGMPDTWEDTYGLDKNDAGDANDYHANGYTHIENYINDLGGDDVPGLTTGGGPPADTTPPAAPGTPTLDPT